MADDLHLLGRLRPEFDVRDVPPALDWERLESDGATAPDRRREGVLGRWKWLAAAVAAALAVAVIFVIREARVEPPAGPSPTTSAPPTATPEPSPTPSPTSLEGLANIAEGIPTPGTGDVAYSRIQTWTPNAGVSTYATELWISPDLSGLVLNSPEPDWGLPSGTFAAGNGVTHKPWCRDSPAEEAVANAGADPDINVGAAGWMWVIQYCALQGPTAGTSQAGMLRGLAAQPGIQERGLMADRTGRTGLAFSAVIDVEGMNGPDETLIILSPETGQLLAIQRTTLDLVPTLGDKATGYHVVFEKAAMVPAVGDRPN